MVWLLYLIFIFYVVCQLLWVHKTKCSIIRKMLFKITQGKVWFTHHSYVNCPYVFSIIVFCFTAWAPGIYCISLLESVVTGVAWQQREYDIGWPLENEPRPPSHHEVLLSVITLITVLHPTSKLLSLICLAWWDISLNSYFYSWTKTYIFKITDSLREMTDVL